MTVNQETVKLADLVINFFASKGIDKIFVVYGAANAPLIDAFKRIKKTKYIATIHEQAGGFIAEGYAKTKIVPGIAIPKSGPGGINLANPKGKVFCIIGDGGMNINIQELQTIKIYNIKIKVIILNNKILGITKAFQKTNYEGKTEAVGPRGYSPTDYIKICKAYGIKTISLKNYNEIDDKINKFLKFDGPVILDVNCKNFYTYGPRIFGWDTPIEDMYPYLRRKEFKSNLFIKPMPNWKNPRKPKFK